MTEDIIQNQNQHYVSQYYFREFTTRKNSISLLVKKNGHPIDNSALKKQSSDTEFYGNSKVEKEITVHDTKYRLNHIEINAKKPTTKLSNGELSTLIENIAFQHKRTLKARITIAPLVDFTHNFVLPQLEHNDANWPQELHDAVYETYKSSSQKNGARIWQTIDLENIKNNAKALSDLKYIILENTTSTPFIFSDSPVVFSNQAFKNGHERSITHEGSAGLLVFFPLSPKKLVLLYDTESYEIDSTRETYITINDTPTIDSINTLQLHEAINAIYFNHPKHTAYVKGLWEKEKNRFNNKANEVVCLPELTADGRETGRLVHTLATTTPCYFPNLPFLLTRRLGTAQTHPYRMGYIINYNYKPT
ncbi:DUF4238 domain-containing protein [Pseudomonas marginalis]|uniref:DUF4238 domain-containing protein n=1 Tax=Pseudomonas marginalis TaxID=298 RepID=UPI002480F19C|nr:DUF4238 domain-containing protein [Pseudomonas marginalis]WGT29629.1 DUF4238 domain-containing protein [Pseudomonas marginalis]